MYIADSLTAIEDLSEFNHFVQKTRVSDILSEAHPYTVFAPKGDILGSFSEIEKSYLRSHEGRDDLASIIERHIHDGAVYLKDLTKGKESLSTIEGEKMKLDIKDKDEIYVDGNRLTSKDFIAANGRCTTKSRKQELSERFTNRMSVNLGVIQQIDNVIIPKNLRFDLRKHMIGMNVTKFVTLLDEAGLGHYLDDNNGSYTILAPLNEALDLDEIPRKYLKTWLSYHIVKDQWKPENFTDGQLLKTESKSDELDGRKQRLKVHVENSGLISSDHKSITFGRSGVAQEPGNLYTQLCFVHMPLQMS